MNEPRPLLGVERSILGRRWETRTDDAAIEAFQQVSGCDRVVSALLAGRGVAGEAAQRYLNPTLKADLPDPSVLTDMDKAASLILDALQAGRKITLFSDYDVDGGTSAAQMMRWGRGLDYTFGLHVPDRVRDGYGPSVKAFETLKADGTDLVVTLDCGAAAHEALAGAADLDLPVVVVDHHLMDGLPPAAAIVNPNRPDDASGLGHLAAAGVTFMLVVALNREAKRRGLDPRLDIRELLGLAGLGTVCDVVPMTGLNRLLVKRGLQVMDRQGIAGLNALSAIANTAPPYTTYHLGFVLGPRINAGGRIGRSEMGAELLSTDNQAIATAHAYELDRLNRDRRAMQDDMLRGAIEQAERQANRAVIVASMEGWHPGVIGIVAGRLKDRFEKPAIVIGIDDDGTGKGSGRSIRGVDLGSALVEAKKSGLLSSGGGHAMAGGLTIGREALPRFTDWIEDRLSPDVATARAAPVAKADMALSAGGVTPDLLGKIEAAGPYGPMNPRPAFAVSGVKIVYANRLNGGHVRFTAEGRGGDRLSGILFRGDETDLGLALLEAGERRVHLLGQVKSNRYKGQTRADFHLTDMAWAD
ncbi:single-stranded-DNA-specific exonuclease RecJ [uncultured Algimonas sp.]|uniref:single-stranded-DNA-specific exonuclease RecJ n=1 Tax=uncultured Algimonas sp. TaxID=1547920 RepID=UPI00261F9ADD|nr:single-stranded-DNA-specific exonuclease RecJ [uncultured Algimonas sp.]